MSRKRGNVFVPAAKGPNITKDKTIAKINNIIEKVRNTIDVFTYKDDSVQN